MLGRGALIVLEGCDKSGKTTQSRKLVEKLCKKRYNAKLLAFPDRTTSIGQLIDSYLKSKARIDDHVIHLLFSANRWEQATNIEFQLQQGTTLVLDRYAYSGVAFSAAKQQMDLEWCKQPDIGLPRPDLVLFMNITPDEAAKRSGYGDEIYENIQFQQKVYNNFLLMKENYWTDIDANRPPEKVSEDLLFYSEDVISKIVQTYPKLQRLWLARQKEFPNT